MKIIGNLHIYPTRSNSPVGTATGQSLHANSGCSTQVAASSLNTSAKSWPKRTLVRTPLFAITSNTTAPHTASASAPGKMRREDYVVHWDAWAQRGEASEERAEAVSRMKKWMKNGRRDAPLNLSGLNLKSLPEHLPAKLGCLDAGNNRLTHLPALPESLLVLKVENNLLLALPATLPSGLLRLTANGNRLTALPEGIEANHDVRCHIYVEDNPMHESVLDKYIPMIMSPGYNGPIIFFSRTPKAAGRKPDQVFKQAPG